MPVTLTLNHLALAVRVTTHLEAPRLPCSDILTRQLAAGATAIVESTPRTHLMIR